MSSTSLPISNPASVPRTRGAGRALHWAVFLALLVALSWAYVTEAARTITRMEPKFTPLEMRHLKLAEETLKDLHPDFSHSFSEPLKRLLPHRTDGVAQPLWPWLACGLLESEEASWKSARLQGGWMQLGWSLGWLILIAMACARSFTLPAALLVVLLLGFQGFLPTVGAFNGACLFQVLFLLTWVACIFGLQRNSLWTYGLVGGLGALAYLAEDRVLPLLIVYIAVSTLRAFWEWLAAHWSREHGTTLWVPRNHGLGLLLMAAFFLFMAGPRLAESHQRFGSAFFAFQDQARWLDGSGTVDSPVEPKSPLVLMQGYLSSHSRQAVWERLQAGLRDVWADFSQNNGRELGAVLAVLAAMFVAMKFATPKATHAGQRLHPESIPAILFMLLAAGVYVVIAGWDVPVTGARGRLLLLQPALALGILWGCESLLRRARRRRASQIFIVSYHLTLWAIVGLASWRVIEGLQAPLSAP